MSTDDQLPPQETVEDAARRPPRPLRRIIFCTIIISIGLLAAWYLIQTKPKISKRPVEKLPPLVSVVPLVSQSQTIRIMAMGSVIPSREIVLKTPVAGEIVAISDNFTAGGLLTENTTILQIDPRDYELAMEQKKRAVSDAEYAYKLEQGRQDVARQEWELLYGNMKNDGVESALALRKPHLEKVQADIKAARAELEQAEIDLARTTVTAPFNALVLNKYVDRGAFVAPQEKLADLVGTDEYWVQVSLPLDRLQWVKIPLESGEPGSAAKIYCRQEQVRDGRVIRLIGDLTKEGRMARLLLSVADPLGLSAREDKPQPLIIGEYVRVGIEGEELHNVFRIPRTALRNDREIWIADEDGRLAIRPVRIVWRDEESVLVQDGLQTGELLVVSDLAVPVDGMAVRVHGETGKEALTDAHVESEDT